jgi:putative ABC transport system permease protein
MEAVIIGSAATIAGLAGGYALAIGLRELLESIGFGTIGGALPVRGRTVLIAAAVGVGATVLSSLGPARRVRSIAPVAALRDQPQLTPAGFSRRLIGGGATVLAGVAMLAIAMFGGLETRPALFMLGIGALSAFGGVYVLSPVAARPVANVLGRPIQRLFRIPGRLAKENAGRRPRRTAATAAALTVGLALVCLAAVVGDSLKTTVVELLDESVSSELFITPEGFGPSSGFSRDLVLDMNAVSEKRPELIKSAIGYRWVFDGMSVDGDNKDVLSTELAALADHMDLDLVDGTISGPATPGTDGTILIHIDPATERNLSIGDPITVAFGGSREVTLTVAATFENSLLLGNWVVDHSTFDRYLPQSQDAFASVVYAPDANPEAARLAIQALTDEYPQVNVEDQREYRESTEAQLDRVLAIITVFLGLSLLIAVLGITNTLALSVYEQTRELGLLRAVGMTRRQMRRMVRWEAVIIALFGGLLGIAIGVPFGLAAVTSIPWEMETSIPVGSLAIYLFVAGIFGILAAILPAYRASRLNVLEAISHQ